MTDSKPVPSGVILRAEEQVRPQTHPPDVHLLIAPVKKSALEFAVEKATELGAARIRLACFDVDGSLTDGRLIYLMFFASAGQAPAYNAQA